MQISQEKSRPSVNLCVAQLNRHLARALACHYINFKVTRNCARDLHISICMLFAFDSNLWKASVLISRHSPEWGLQAACVIAAIFTGNSQPDRESDRACCEFQFCVVFFRHSSISSRFVAAAQLLLVHGTKQSHFFHDIITPNLLCF